jgi:hypothetical protein
VSKVVANGPPIIASSVRMPRLRQKHFWRLVISIESNSPSLIVRFGATTSTRPRAMPKVRSLQFPISHNLQGSEQQPFYGQIERTHTVFDRLPLAAHGAGRSSMCCAWVFMKKSQEGYLTEPRHRYHLLLKSHCFQLYWRDSDAGRESLAPYISPLVLVPIHLDGLNCHPSFAKEVIVCHALSFR